MDKISVGFNHRGMAKPALKRPPKQYAPIYLAEWLDALGVAPVELVKAGLISEGYLSHLRNGIKLNPSPGKLMQIGAFLKIQWTDLYRPPPSRDTLEQLETLDPATLARIRARSRR